MNTSIETATEHPYGVGRISIGWLIVVAILAVVLLVGFVAWGNQILQGKVVTGARDLGQMGGAAWGIYIALMLFALGVGFVGVAVVALTHVFGLEQLRPLSRIAEVLSLSALVIGLLAIMADLGQPFRALPSLLQYARPQSPFYGTMLLVLTYMVGVLVVLYLGGRRDAAILAERPGRLNWLYRAWASGYRDTPEARARHGHACFWLGISMLVLLVLYHTTLGLVFALIESRPVWSSPLLPVWHFVLNAISGLGGVLILIAALIRVTLGAQSVLDMRVFRPLATILLVAIGLLLFVVYIEVMSAVYSGPAIVVEVIRENFLGAYAPLTWLSIVLMGTAFLLLVGQALRGHRLSLIVTSAALVTIATFLQRYVVVVSSQTHGNFLPYAAGSYAPSMTEIAVVGGFLALGALFYLVFMKVFPILSLEEDEEAHRPAMDDEARKSVPLRMLTVVALIGAGLLIQGGAYFLFGAPWGFPPDSVAYSNPNLPFAPLVFLIGVCTVYASAVVYELWPDPTEIPRDEGAQPVTAAEPVDA